MKWFRPARRPRGRPPHPDALTPAEWRVLDLVREGRTNPEIAEHLGLSLNTVKTHVSAMLAKLHLRDRGALAAWEGEPALASTRVRRAPLAIVPGWVGKVVLGAVVAVVAGGVVMLMQDSGTPALPGDDTVAESPTPAATTNPKPTEPSEAPSSPTPTPVVDLVDGLPAGATGPLLLFGEVIEERARDRNWPVVQMHVYDVGAGQSAATFPVGSVGSYAANIHIAEREVIANMEHSIVAFALDGTTREVYRAPADGRLETAFVSPDEAMIAFSERLQPVTGWRDSIVVVEIATGDEVLRVDSDDPVFSEVQVQLNLRGWQGNETVIAIDHTGEGIVQMVLVRLDGTVTYDAAANGRPSPDGRLTMRTTDRVREEEFSAYGCWLQERLDVHALPSPGSPIAGVTFPGTAMWTSYWSPDSTGVLLSTRTLPDPDVEVEVDLQAGEIQGCGPPEFWERAPDWYLLDVATNSVEPVPNPREVWRRWADTRYPSVEMECFLPDGSERHPVLPGQYVPSCEQGGQAAIRALIVDGREVARGPGQRAFGWVDVP